ncbi:MAG: hypothetical protein J6575_03730 [Bifidobacterium sp.]|nr:hypothetical protein [Bifidobacterium sp.]
MKKNREDKASAGTIRLSPWQLAAIVIAAVLAASIVTGLVVSHAVSPQPAELAQTDTSESIPKREPKKPAVQQKRNNHGNLVKHVGDVSATCASEGSCAKGDYLTAMKVTAITPDVQCPGDGTPDPMGILQDRSKPRNGHLVAFDVEVTTKPDSTGRNTFHDGPWTYYNADGSQWNGNPERLGSGCFPQDQMLPQFVSPGSSAKGKIIFDLPSIDGSLALNSGNGGWEYPLSK